MANATIEKRYAKAMFRICENNVESAKKLSANLQPVDELFSVADAQKVLCSPVMPIDLKNELLTYAVEKSSADDKAKQFIKALSEAGRIALIPGILSAFRNLIAATEGVVKAEIVSAKPLAKEQEEKLRAAIGRGKPVDLELNTDAGLLGGVVVRIGNAIVDLSLKTRLQRIAQEAMGN